MPVLVATDIAARGLDIDMLPHVVNFELPNVPEDYVHRIGRTGRAGSNGAAISLVDSEELDHLKNIERLIKTQIPRVAIDSFVPPTHIPAEAPRPPRPQHGQKRHSNTTGGNRAPREGQPARDGQAPRNPDAARRNQQPRTGTGSARPGQARADQAQARPGATPARPAQPRTAPQKPMSEAARHQAMPQPALFSPRPAVRRGK